MVWPSLVVKHAFKCVRFPNGMTIARGEHTFKCVRFPNGMTIAPGEHVFKRVRVPNGMAIARGEHAFKCVRMGFRHSNRLPRAMADAGCHPSRAHAATLRFMFGEVSGDPKKSEGFSIVPN